MLVDKSRNYDYCVTVETQNQFCDKEIATVFSVNG